MLEPRTFLGHAGRAFGQTVEEIADIDLEEARDVEQLGRRYTVDALLVFLDLLEGQAQGAPQIALVIPQADTFFAYATADIPVYRMGAVMRPSKGCVT